VFEEPPIWKNRRFQLYQQYTRIDELEIWDKVLAATLRKFGPTHGFNNVTWSDGYYNYLLRDDAEGTVVRIAKKFCERPDSMREPRKEKGHHERKPYRQKTLDVAVKRR
jgi:hypothetical protein